MKLSGFIGESDFPIGKSESPIVVFGRVSMKRRTSILSVIAGGADAVEGGDFVRDTKDSSVAILSGGRRVSTETV